MSVSDLSDRTLDALLDHLRDLDLDLPTTISASRDWPIDRSPKSDRVAVYGWKDCISLMC